MRQVITAGIGLLLLAVPECLATDRLATALPGSPASPPVSQVAALHSRGAGMSGYGVIAIAAGTAVGVIAANFLTGGLITPLLTVGVGSTGATAGAAAPAMASMGMAMPMVGAAAPAAAVAATGAAGAAATAGAAGASAAGSVGLGMVVGTAAEMSVMVAAPAALAHVGAPVDAALRDGYTTPSVLIAAFGESAMRAGEMVRDAGAYVGSTASAWLAQR